MSDELAKLDATAQAELVRRGEVAPLELVQAAIERIERINPKLNAVIHRSFERAMAQARSGQAARRAVLRRTVFVEGPWRRELGR